MFFILCSEMVGIDSVILVRRIPIQLSAHVVDQGAGRGQCLGYWLVSQAFDEPRADYHRIGQLGNFPGSAGIPDAEPDADWNAHVVAYTRQRVTHQSHVQRLGTGDTLNGDAIDIATGAFSNLPDASFGRGWC